MTKRERVEAIYRLAKPDRVAFVPAIYEHKGKLIGKRPSEVCRDADLLYEGMKRELAVYDPDMLVAGIDVYNVEAEALGAKVVYFEDSDDVPGIVEPLISSPVEARRLRVPDAERAGRMPLYLEAAEAIQREHGEEMIIRGAVSGPFSMASMLLGAERLLLAAVEAPEQARELVEFCARVTVEFGRAFVRRGVEPILFDSRATPQLVSPRVFRNLVLPVYRDHVIGELRGAGARYIPLIIGGKTSGVLEDLIATGATQLLCDEVGSLGAFREKCGQAGVAFRANVDARLVHRGPAEAVRRQALEILESCRDQPGFLLGCGVVVYETPPEHVLAIREAIEEAGGQTQP